MGEALGLKVTPPTQQITKLFGGSTYRDDERVQDDSEIKKQFFEALGVMPTEQSLDTSR